MTTEEANKMPSQNKVVASPRYKTTLHSLEDEIFGSKNERESFIRKFDEINDGGDE